MGKSPGCSPTPSAVPPLSLGLVQLLRDADEALALAAVVIGGRGVVITDHPFPQATHHLRNDLVEPSHLPLLPLSRVPAVSGSTASRDGTVARAIPFQRLQ